MSNLISAGKFFTQISRMKFFDKLVSFGIAHSVSSKKYWPQKYTLNSFNIFLLIDCQFLFTKSLLEMYRILKTLKNFFLTFVMLLHCYYSYIGKRHAQRPESFLEICTISKKYCLFIEMWRFGVFWLFRKIKK